MQIGSIKKNQLTYWGKIEKLSLVKNLYVLSEHPFITNILGTLGIYDTTNLHFNVMIILLIYIK